MIKILAISNSFGVDATRYLHQIAKSSGEDLLVHTLYIGGCSLQTHHQNMQSEKDAYELFVNGFSTKQFISLKNALLSNEWNVITLQQSSPLSGVEQSYYPYLSDLSSYVKSIVPNAKQLIHQTWAYPKGSEMFSCTPFTTREQMIPAIKTAYENAVKAINAQGIIPCLGAMNTLYNAIGNRAYLDGLHASLGIGRYTLSCVWYCAIYGKAPNFSCDVSLDLPASKEELEVAKNCVISACKEYNLI